MPELVTTPVVAGNCISSVKLRATNTTTVLGPNSLVSCHPNVEPRGHGPREVVQGTCRQAHWDMELTPHIKSRHAD
jgi:hypothetical protein